MPLVLGLFGLLPFWGLAVGLMLPPQAPLPAPGTLGWALAFYGAIIVSFLGGIRWGLATGRTEQGGMGPQYAAAVVPSLLAWAALALPLPGALAALAIVVLALGLVDQRLIAQGLAPRWFGRLRLMLSGGAGTALLLAAATLAARGG